MIPVRPLLGAPGWAYLALSAASLPWALPCHAQEGSLRVDVRVGAVYAGPVAHGEALAPEDVGTNRRGRVEIRPGIGPWLEGGLLYGVTRAVDGEVRVGVSRSSLESTGPGSSWDAGHVTGVSVAGHLAVRLHPRFRVRGGLGKLFYASDAVLFEDGSSTGLLLSGGVGVGIPATLPFDLRADADVQWHQFGSPVLREAGAPDGSTYRLTVGLAATIGVRP